MSDAAKPPRDEKGRFPPGVSGNTSGRSTDRSRFEKRLRTLGMKSEKFLNQTLDAALELKACDQDEGASALRAQGLKAATFVLEQRYGKAKQTQELTGKDGADLNPFASLPTAELRALVLATIATTPESQDDSQAAVGAVHGVGEPPDPER